MNDNDDFLVVIDDCGDDSDRISITNIVLMLIKRSRYFLVKLVPKNPRATYNAEQ